MWKVIILCTVGLMAAQKATYENYKIIEITALTPNQVDMLNEFRKISNGYIFWVPPSVNKQTFVVVAPNKWPEFCETMKQMKIWSYKVIDSNIQLLIDKTLPPNNSTKYDFNNYHHLNTIYTNLNELADEYPDKVQIIVGGKSYEGRQIKGVKVSFKPNNPGIFLEGGIHAWEWISHATVMYILHQLLTSNNTDVRNLAENHDWYIFPVFNPDGYVYSHTTDRLWRKTRKPNKFGCSGTDPNRNWDYHWNETVSNNACSFTYAGDAPFSEPETKTMSKYIKSIQCKIFSYISFHSYSQVLMFPFGYTKDHSADYDDMYDIAFKTVKALKKRHGTKYKIGNIAETIYMASGGSVDWVKGTCDIPLTFVYELRDDGRYCFLLPPDQIIPTGEETLDSLVAMFKEAKKRGYRAKC